MNADLERLIALQKLDSTADAARRTLAAEPEHEQALEARLEAATQHVADAKEKLAANKNARGALEKDVAVHQGRLSKFREQAMAVKTNQEYHAIQHEIAFAQTEIKTLEDKILERMLEADELTAARQARRGRARRRAEGRRSRPQDDGGGAERAQDDAGPHHRRAREPRAGARPEDSRDVRTGGQEARNGIAVAEARDGICTICHVRLRPQVFNTVRRNDAIIQCDHCNRILYFVPVPVAPPAAPNHVTPQAVTVRHR